MRKLRPIVIEKQLDRLPAGAIARDKDGDAWQKNSDGYWLPAGGDAFADSEYVAQFAPIYVLWEGGDDGKAAQHT